MLACISRERECERSANEAGGRRGEGHDPGPAPLPASHQHELAQPATPHPRTTVQTSSYVP